MRIVGSHYSVEQMRRQYRTRYFEWGVEEHLEFDGWPGESRLKLYDKLRNRSHYYVFPCHLGFDPQFMFRFIDVLSERAYAD